MQLEPRKRPSGDHCGVMRKRQKYTDDPDVVATSVITLNATTAAQAANDFLFYMTGLAQ